MFRGNFPRPLKTVVGRFSELHRSTRLHTLAMRTSHFIPKGYKCRNRKTNLFIILVSWTFLRSQCLLWEKICPSRMPGHDFDSTVPNSYNSTHFLNVLPWKISSIHCIYQFKPGKVTVWQISQSTEAQISFNFSPQIFTKSMFQIRFIDLTNIYTKSQTTELFHTALVRQSLSWN